MLGEWTGVWMGPGWMDGWNSGRRVPGTAEARVERRTRLWGLARTLWGSVWEKWGKGDGTQTVKLRPKRRGLGTTWAQGIVADKVGSGGSSVRQDAEGTAAGPRGR